MRAYVVSSVEELRFLLGRLTRSCSGGLGTKSCAFTANSRTMEPSWHYEGWLAAEADQLRWPRGLDRGPAAISVIRDFLQENCGGVNSDIFLATGFPG